MFFFPAQINPGHFMLFFWVIPPESLTTPPQFTHPRHTPRHSSHVIVASRRLSVVLHRIISYLFQNLVLVVKKSRATAFPVSFLIVVLFAFQCCAAGESALGSRRDFNAIGKPQSDSS